jgi:hypothetical protein
VNDMGNGYRCGIKGEYGDVCCRIILSSRSPRGKEFNTWSGIG